MVRSDSPKANELTLRINSSDERAVTLINRLIPLLLLLVLIAPHAALAEALPMAKANARIKSVSVCSSLCCAKALGCDQTTALVCASASGSRAKMDERSPAPPNHWRAQD